MKARQLIVVAGALALFLSACSSDCKFNESSLGWSYRGKRLLTWKGTSCHRQLIFDEKQIVGGNRIVNPIGTFAIIVLSEEGGTDAGWKKVGVETSVGVPLGSQRVSPSQLRDGFYESDGRTRLLGTPPDWAHLGNIHQPVWVAPSRLQDLRFFIRHSDPAKSR